MTPSRMRVAQAPNVELNPQEKKYRTELVELYKAKLAGKNDVSGLEYPEFMQVIHNTIQLSHNLFALGKEREANKLRKDAKEKLVSRAEEKEKLLFEQIAVKKDTNDKGTKLQEELSELNKVAKPLSEDLARKAAALEELGDAEAEAKAALEAEVSALKQQLEEMGKTKAKPIIDEIRKQSVRNQSAQRSIQFFVQEALNFKLESVKLMFEVDDVHGAFELALNTIKEYHANELFGVAEKLLVATIEVNSINVSTLMKKGQMAEVHKLNELAAEYSLYGAQMIEQELGIADEPEAVSIATQLRKYAAGLSLQNGDYDDVEEILVRQGSDEYKAKGLSDFSLDLLLSAADLYHMKADEFMEAHNMDEARKLLDRAISIKLGVAAEIEQKVASGELQKEMIDTAEATRENVIHMYVHLGKFAEIHEMVSSVSENYKANGHDEAYLRILEYGASVAANQGNVLKSAKRDPAPIGQYL